MESYSLVPFLKWCETWSLIFDFDRHSAAAVCLQRDRNHSAAAFPTGDSPLATSGLQADEYGFCLLFFVQVFTTACLSLSLKYAPIEFSEFTLQTPFANFSHFSLQALCVFKLPHTFSCSFLKREMLLVSAATAVSLNFSDFFFNHLRWKILLM